MLIKKNADIECCDICYESICLKGQLTPDNICPICHKHICNNCGPIIKIKNEKLFMCCNSHNIEEIKNITISELRNRDFKLPDNIPVRISGISFEKI